VERELLPCLRKLGIAFYLYNPLCGGLLAKTELKVNEEVEQGSRFDPSTNQGSM
jgi:aflatoxin B1 aldehyde reductase